MVMYQNIARRMVFSRVEVGSLQSPFRGIEEKLPDALKFREDRSVYSKMHVRLPLAF